MRTADRGSTPRYNTRIPLRFRRLDEIRIRRLCSRDQQYLQDWNFFISKIPLMLGTAAQSALRIPREFSRSAKSIVQCVGRIAREEEFPDDSMRYGTRTDFGHPRVLWCSPRKRRTS